MSIELTVKNFEVEESSQTNYETLNAHIDYSIMLNGAEIGTVNLTAYNYNEESEEAEDIVYVEKIDIDEEFRGNGYGTETLNTLSRMWGEIALVADNERAEALYERLGTRISELAGDMYEKYESVEYCDCGFGSFVI